MVRARAAHNGRVKAANGKARSVADAPALGRELTEHGLRATRQRVALLGLLRSFPGHPTVVDLHESLLERHGTLSRKTVYEILDSFVRVGLASCPTEGQPARYEANEMPHDHARCRSCGRLFDLPPGAAGRRTARPPGFRVEDVRVLVLGVCRDCDRTARPKR